MAFEAVSGQLHQLRRRRQVPVGVLGIDMPEIGRQQREPGFRIVALPIGVEQRTHCKAMSDIVQPRPTGRRLRCEAGTPDQRVKRVLHIAVQQPGDQRQLFLPVAEGAIGRFVDPPRVV